MDGEETRTLPGVEVPNTLTQTDAAHLYEGVGDPIFEVPLHGETSFLKLA